MPLTQIFLHSPTTIKRFMLFIVELRIALRPLAEKELANFKKSHFLAAIEEKKRALNKGFIYEFSDDDLSRVQELINELRNEISLSELFESGHKSRLLRRLEALQSELHKKMSDIDKFWGLFGEAGIVLGKFGNDAKPIVDRVKELSNIVWRTQTQAEDVPQLSSNPLLGNDSGSDGK